MTDIAWLFAYGSLMFRPEHPAAVTRRARVRGYVRRLAQGSPDHRGTPEHPGRVATLLEQPDADCFGVAQSLPVDPTVRDDLLHALERREQGGYSPVHVSVEFDDGSAAKALTWIAYPDNPHFLGDATPEDIAAHVARSHGPSGANRAYVLNLAEALRTLGVEDPHVMAVEAALVRAARSDRE